MADTSQVKLRALEESSWGETPAAAMDTLRFVSESLGYNIATKTSDEIRGDRNITDLVQTEAETGGDIAFELSYGTFDKLMAAALFSVWNTAVNLAGTTFSASAVDNSFNDSGEGFVAGGIVAGQWLKVAGFTEPENNGYFKVISVAVGKIVVSGGTLKTENAGDSVTIKGQCLKNGTTQTSFTLEKEFADVEQFVSLTGMVPSTFSLNLAAGEIVNGSLSFLGKAAAIAQATVGTGAANAATTTEVLNAVSNVASIRENGAAISGTYARSMAIQLENNLRGKKAVSVLGNTGIGAGRCNVSGSIELYFEDETYVEKYYDNTSTSIDFRLADAAGNTYIITLHRVEYSSGDPVTPGADQDVMVTLNYTALYDATAGCTIQIDKFAA